VSEVADQLAGVIRSIVDRPEAVRVEEIEEEDAIVLQVEVAPEELGRVIGRQGRSVRSLRALLEVRGAETGEYYEVEIVEPD
jgi:predicted RNA-binding protein YlqC (UPF0109 family)